MIQKFLAISTAFVVMMVMAPMNMRSQDETIIDSELVLVSPGQTVDWSFSIPAQDKTQVKGSLVFDETTKDSVWAAQGCVGGFCFMSEGGPEEPVSGNVECQLRLFVPNDFTGEGKTAQISLRLQNQSGEMGVANLYVMAVKPFKANFVAGEKPILVSEVKMENCLPVKTESEHNVVSKTAPTIIKGSMMIPFRILGEIVGAEVGWNANTNEASYMLGPKKVVLRKEIGKARIIFSGFEKSIEVKPAPANVNGNIMVPLRFVTEALGGAVVWDAPTKTATIQFPGCRK